MTAKLKEYPELTLTPESIESALDFEDIFGRKAAVHIEIGSGKGTFLLNQAKAMPEMDFIGIEWARKYCRHAIDRLGRWGIKNVRIIRTEAADFLREHIKDGSVDCFHIYFPDPWPKKKHNKRRLVNLENFDQLLRCLKPTGIIKFATDHADYFEQVKKIIAEKTDRVEIIDFTPAAGTENGEITGTNYERKYIKDKRDIQAVAVRKTA
ncbi:MAG: tRNA (guanosine(46)-N7)-methyltransferase TrmB [Phycisphaerae bacterium]|nr:tRNA (guanosine(46)-N7)-methyltransferase TrmB [Phycisphaerae bacterium]